MVGGRRTRGILRNYYNDWGCFSFRFYCVIFPSKTGSFNRGLFSTVLQGAFYSKWSNAILYKNQGEEKKFPRVFPHVLFLEPQTGNAFMFSYWMLEISRKEAKISVWSNSFSPTSEPFWARASKLCGRTGLWRWGPLFFWWANCLARLCLWTQPGGFSRVWGQATPKAAGHRVGWPGREGCWDWILEFLRSPSLLKAPPPASLEFCLLAPLAAPSHRSSASQEIFAGRPTGDDLSQPFGCTQGDSLWLQFLLFPLNLTA